MAITRLRRDGSTGSVWATFGEVAAPRTGTSRQEAPVAVRGISGCLVATTATGGEI